MKKNLSAAHVMHSDANIVLANFGWLSKYSSGLKLVL